MIRFILMCLCLVYTTVHAQSVWTIDSSVVNFHIKNAGITVTGSFSGLQSEIKFNPKKLKKSSIVASVDTRTVDTGIRIRDKHLIKQEYFHTEVHSSITMMSQSFRKTGQNQFQGIFIISIKGISDTISFPFIFTSDGKYGTISGSFEIDRNDFGIGGRSLLIADNVKIDLWVKGKMD